MTLGTAPSVVTNVMNVTDIQMYTSKQNADVVFMLLLRYW